MKKKALITATAVLLVAVMCLATASYAWFTAGSTATIEALSLDVKSADAALLLAPAQPITTGYEAGTYESSLEIKDWNTSWIVNSEELIACSTDGVYSDGFNFFPAEYSTANQTWTTKDAAKSGYVLLSFYAKAPVNGSAKFNVATSGTGADTFGTVVKLGYNVTACANATTNAVPGNLTTYDFAPDTTDLYRPCKAAGAVSYKTAADDATNPASFEPVDAQSTAFATARTTQSAFTTQTINFTANVPQLFTIALWVEGMDDDCTGSFTLEDVGVALSFTDWAAA